MFPGSSSIWLQPARPELVDEWLQVRNALSIEIFLQHTLSVVHPAFCA